MCVYRERHREGEEGPAVRAGGHENPGAAPQRGHPTRLLLGQR